jgi:hypothetical protein
MSNVDPSELVRPYTDNDYPDLIRWYMEWDEAVPPKEMLPYNGFIVPGICAGFLYLTDTKLGIIDCYISNPMISPHVRNKYLILITNEIIDAARFNGCKALMATSNITAVKKRAEFHGFKYRGETSVYMKEI